jgi:CheY-like chemotaxis protein
MQRAAREPDACPLRVLIVDPHEVSRAACSALLRTEGVAVADAAPGDRVIELLRTFEPDLVLIDPERQSTFRHTVLQMRACDPAPLVLVTSSGERERLDPLARQLPFLAKADVCAAAIFRAVLVTNDDAQLPRESGE